MTKRRTKIKRRKLKPLHQILNENPGYKIEARGITHDSWKNVDLELNDFLYDNDEWNDRCPDCWFEPKPEPKKLYAYKGKELKVVAGDMEPRSLGNEIIYTDKEYNHSSRYPRLPEYDINYDLLDSNTENDSNFKLKDGQ